MFPQVDEHIGWGVDDHQQGGDVVGKLWNTKNTVLQKLKSAFEDPTTDNVFSWLIEWFVTVINGWDRDKDKNAHPTNCRWPREEGLAKLAQLPQVRNPLHAVAHNVRCDGEEIVLRTK